MAWNDNLPANTPAYGIASDEMQRIRVVAGPGTGKSFSLRRRVARLIEEEEVDPARILAVTFTRIAAEDIQRELHSLDVEGADNIEARTLHSLAMRILGRQNVIESLGRETRPMGTFEVEPLLHDLSSDHGGKREREERLQSYLAAFATDQDDDPLDCADQEDRAFRRELVDWLRFHRAMLIGEIIPFLYTYLRDNPAAEEFDDFDHILVDEYQDLNKVEQGVVDHIGRDAVMMIVGDENQSIYSFKHAHPEGILEWEDEGERSDHQLSECYRCPRRVVSMANSLISNNPGGSARPLVAREANGEGLVSILQFQTSDAEADGVVADIVRRIDAGTPPQDILVLTPRKMLGMKIANGLREAAVPHREYLSESPLQSDDVTERLCLLLVAADRDDRPALRWLIGRGHSTYRAPQYARLREYCEQEDVSPWDALCQLADGELSLPHTRQMVERFAEIRHRVETLSAMLEASDIIEELFPQGDDEFARIRDLVVADVDDEMSLEDVTSLIWEKMYEPDFPDDAEYVRIMTLYGSKGLGTPIVYVTSLNDELLPAPPEPGDSRRVITRKDQEQRRLLYVALTRAKTDLARGLPGELLLSSFRLYGYDEAHRFNGGNINARASRFIAEMGPDAPRTQRGP